MYYGSYGYGYGFYDPTIILMIIAFIISAIAQAQVSGAFSKFSRVYAHCGMTGAQVAEKILHTQGIYNVSIRHIDGKLTDHFDPRSMTVNLSDSVFQSTSVAAVAVAAHECGHAVQHDHGYLPLILRSALVPVVNIATKASWVFIILGMILGMVSSLTRFGILLFCAMVLFQLVTLPVEFNASHRALKILKENGILETAEEKNARKVLTAAAMTYVAAALTSILQLLRLIILFGGRRSDD